MDWFATGLSIIGTFFVVKKHYFGQILYLFSNILWVIFAFMNNISSQLLLFLFYFIMSIVGAYSWYKEHKKVSEEIANL